MSKEDDGTLRGAHTELWDHDRGRGARHTLLDQPERALTCRAHPTDLTKTWVARLPSFGSLPSIHFTHSSFSPPPHTPSHIFFTFSNFTTSSAMPRIKAPSKLPELVKSTFTKARSDGDLHYFPTQVAILHVDSIPVSVILSLLTR
jgi:hypothetical protein